MSKREQKQKPHVGRVDVKINQHAPVFQDRRTKRNRDKGTANRAAIREQQ